MSNQFFRLIASCFLLVMAFSACSQTHIKGEGETVKQEITLDKLRGIKLGFSGDVVLTQGSNQKIVMEGQQNILNNIKREVKDGVWHIYFEKSVRDAKNVTIYVTLPRIEEIGLTGSGEIHSTNKFSGLNDIEIGIAGSGDITFEYEARSTELNLSGSGEINLSGNSPELSISISGSGEVMASQLETDNCHVRISGSGDATVFVNNNLSTQISGSGDVHYSGRASVEAKITGSGEVSKL